MQTRKGHWSALSLGVAFGSVLTLQSAWAGPENPDGKGDYYKGEYSHGKGDAEHGKGYGKDGNGYRGGHGMMGGLHASTGHLIRHMLKHSTEIGLIEDQVEILTDMQLTLYTTRIKDDYDSNITER